MSKLGDRLRVLYTNQQVSPSQADSWTCIAEAFANEVRHDAIPWAHNALDEVGAPTGPDIAGRIRELVNVSSRRSLELHARIEEVERQRDQAVKDVEDAHVALNAAGFCEPELVLADRIRRGRLPHPAPSVAIASLETLLAYSHVARDELRAIIVEAIKGGGEGK